MIKSRFRKSCGSGQSADEEHDGGGVEEGAGRGDGGLEVLCQSPVAVDPGEEALHDPAARLDGEAGLIGLLRTISTAITVAVATFSPA